MSLQINERRVTRVLLADGWPDAQGFDLDAYEFGVYYPDHDYASGVGFHCVHGGGQSGVCATGFVFRDVATGRQIAGPLTAILAVSGEDITLTAGPDDPDVTGRPVSTACDHVWCGRHGCGGPDSHTPGVPCGHVCHSVCGCEDAARVEPSTSSPAPPWAS